LGGCVPLLPPLPLLLLDVFYCDCDFVIHFSCVRLAECAVFDQVWSY
jgi:hypothetical protein